MHLVCSIFFSTATNYFTVLVTHFVSTNNAVADSLSCLQISWFCYLTSASDPDPTPVPLDNFIWQTVYPSSNLRRSWTQPTTPTRLAFGDTLTSVAPEDGKVSLPLRSHYASCRLLGWPSQLQDHKVIYGRPPFYTHQKQPTGPLLISTTPSFPPAWNQVHHRALILSALPCNNVPSSTD